VTPYGWRARLGILVPPGNPTVEPEFFRMAPAGVSLHFARLQAAPDVGRAGGATGMEERTRAYRESLAGPAGALGAVRPAVVVLAHTASSYALGFAHEQSLADRIATLTHATALPAARAIVAALRHLGVTRLALGTPYPEAIGAQARAYWEAAGFTIVSHRRLGGVDNIYAESEERACELARDADARQAEAVLLSGTGLPTIGALEILEHELGKPVLSSNQASLWQALRLAGVREAIPGFGRLLRET
jgi:maleate cis-trans isomerase